MSELTNSVAALENQTTHSPEVVVKEKVAKVQEQVQKAEQQYHSMETKLQGLPSLHSTLRSTVLAIVQNAQIR